MTNSISDQLNQMAGLLQQSMTASDERMTRLEQSMTGSDERMTRLEQSMTGSDERMTRLEQSMERNAHESNERLTRIEQSIEQVEQVVKSNNRFLESFGESVKRFTDTAFNLTQRIDGMIASTNQQRDESNSRLAGIQRQVNAIAKHLGVDER